ncbi:MAG: DUF4157 domain-containing protein [Anaerolineaceae bacterium]|nr:DUF4157 domain-containing protein [Anaerolineaceae bacterium]
MSKSESERVEKAAEKPAAPQTAAPEQEDLQPLELPAPLQAAISSGASPSDPTDNQARFLADARLSSRREAVLRQRFVGSLQQHFGNRHVQRVLAERNKLDLQRQSSDGSLQAGRQSTDQIAQQRSGGMPLPSTLQSQMEDAFGTDFSQVRLHTGPEAQALSESLAALAFTSGADIWLANPNDANNPNLLAHELTHVIQQDGQSAPSGQTLQVSEPGDASEQQAEQVAGTLNERVHSGELQDQSKGIRRSAAFIQRQGDPNPDPAPAATTTPAATTAAPTPAPGQPAALQLAGASIDTCGAFLLFTLQRQADMNTELQDVDQNAEVRSRAAAWIESTNKMQSTLREKSADPIDTVTSGIASWWYQQFEDVRRDIRSYKAILIEDAFVHTQAELADTKAKVDAAQPFLEDAMRAAFLKGKSDAIADIANYVGTVTDIGMGISDLSRMIAEGVASAKGGTIPEASKYVEWLNKANKVLAGINALYILSSVQGPTEIATASNAISGAAGLFSAGATLLNVAPHIGLYADLYLVPLTVAIMDKVNAFLTSHLHQFNIYDIATGQYPSNLDAEPGGKPMFDFMVVVMHAEDESAVPQPIPAEVNKYFMSQREQVNAGAQEEMPTTGWWFWRKAEETKIESWVFEHRRNLWSMFYGSLDVPTLDILNKAPPAAAPQ